MNKHTIVGISGKQGSGKTTLAKALVEKYSGGHMKFATPLYKMQEAIRGILKEYGYTMKEKDGKLLQLLGTEWGRHTLGQNIWADLTTNAIYDTIQSLDRWKDRAFIVVDDARFENELEVFLKLKAAHPEWAVLSIRLEADEDARRIRADDWRPHTDHPSEVGLDHMVDKFDMVLDTGLLSAQQVLERVTSRIDELSA